MVFTNFLTDFKLPNDWLYRGEGNAHLVLALPKTKQILRIRKTRPTLRFYLAWLFNWISDLIYWYFGSGYRNEKTDIKFYMKIMRPLFGVSYVSEAQQVVLAQDQIRRLEKKLDKFRPEFRKDKILDYSRATLFDDFTCFTDDFLPFQLSNDSFSFEFKPKQDWEPVVTRLSDCTFCMHQYYKLETKKVRQHSKYCPRDLFCGLKPTVSKALKNLIDTPQNNFRVFKNGELIYDDKQNVEFTKVLNDLFDTTDKNLKGSFFDLMHSCLTKNLVGPKTPTRCDKKWLCEWNRQLNASTQNYHLEKDSVLERILSVQMLNMDGTSYYNKLLKNKEVKDWRYVKKGLKEINKYPETCLKCVMMLLAEKDKDFLFMPYLMAAVANDCSFMITVKKVLEPVDDDMGIRNIVHTELGSFVVRIGIFDLYPKPVSTIVKHENRNKKILQAYRRHNPNKID